MSKNVHATLLDLHSMFDRDRQAMINKCAELLAEDESFTPALMMMALAAYAGGDQGLAIQFLENAHEQAPYCKEYVDLLAAILPRVGRLSDSLYYGKLSVSLDPDPVLAYFVPKDFSSYQEALVNVSLSSHAMVAELALRAGSFEDALKQCDEEIRINPTNAEAMIISARALLGLSKPSAATNTLRAAVHLVPQSAWLHCWFAEALIASGKHGEAVPHLRLAVKFEPEDLALASHLAGLTEWLDDAQWADTAEIREHLLARIQAKRGTKTPEQRPTTKMIGLIYDQCHQSTMTSFLLPTIKGLGDTVLYRINQRHDAETKAFHFVALRVRECAEVDMATLGRTMLGDQISALFYLGIPTLESKYIKFAGSGGPICIQGLSDPLVNHLPTTEWIIGDAETYDLDVQNFGAEHVIRLEHLASCQFAEAPAPDEKMTPLPRDQAGEVTFGVWADLRRMTPGSIALWSQCLLAVPGSRLLIGGRSAWEDGLLHHLHDLFAEYGVGSRIRIHPRADALESPLAFLANVDVLLDSAPVSVGPELAQTLWMGVPVVTLKGKRRAGRFGASILRAAGCSQWIAESDAAYIEIAQALAQSADLAELRAGLRDKVLASPLAAHKEGAKALHEAVLSVVSPGKSGLQL